MNKPTLYAILTVMCLIIILQLVIDNDAAIHVLHLLQIILFVVLGYAIGKNKKKKNENR